MIVTGGSISVAVSIFDAAMAAVAGAAAVYVGLRDGRWRKDGLASQLSDRIDAAQKAADDWHETPVALAMKAEIERQAVVLNAHDGALAQVATRTDVARIEGAIKNVESQVEDAAGGVDRIEGMLIHRALNPERG